MSEAKEKLAPSSKLLRMIDVLNSPWAIIPQKLVEIREIYLRHLRGDEIDLSGIEAQLGRPLNNQPRPLEIIEGVAVLPLHGVVGKRMNLFTEISGGTSTQLLAKDFQAALEDPQVHSIVLDVDSPGGDVDGTLEMARLVREARGRKPILALGDGLMASAAYWIGSAADRVFITGETTQVGSIGVVATHIDISRAREMRGVKFTEITAGRFKRITSENAPLSEEGRDTIQDEVDYIYSVFVNDVAKHRGRDVDTVLNNMADGRIFLGNQAIEAGLVDGEFTLLAVIDLLNQEQAAQGQTGAAVILDRHVAPNSSTKGGPMAPKDGSIQVEIVQLAPEELEKRENAAHERGRSEGATAERERIQAVEAQALPGHQALLQELKFDGTTTGPQAAERILGAENAKRAKAVEDMKAEAPAPVAATVPAEVAGEETGETIEDRCKAEWKKKAELRTEFSTVEQYTAYMKAAERGQARIFGQKEA